MVDVSGGYADRQGCGLNCELAQMYVTRIAVFLLEHCFPDCPQICQLSSMPTQCCLVLA